MVQVFSSAGSLLGQFGASVGEDSSGLGRAVVGLAFLPPQGGGGGGRREGDSGGGGGGGGGGSSSENV